MKLVQENKKELLKAALGEIPSDLALVNCRLVNVFIGEIYPAVVYVKGKWIVYVEKDNLNPPFNAGRIYDARGQYLIPGFVDSHMHIESSMMTPRNFAKAVIPHGTTTIIHDPHELANVYGVEGVKYMHDCGEGLPMRQLVDIPSCVPAVPECENAGATFMASAIRELAGLERVVGLAEVMDFIGVMNGDERMMEIIEAAREAGLYLQGHAPGLKGRQLAAYLIGGPRTCHETTMGDEALEKLRNGMYVDARESSISRNVEAIWGGVKDSLFFDTLTLCSDDRESDDLLHVGHMNAVVRKVIQAGMDPVAAIKSATVNTAREIGMEHLGALAPGFVADMVVVDDLRELNAKAVFFEGELVAENGCLTVSIPDKTYPLEKKNSMDLERTTAADFMYQATLKNGSMKVNVMEYDTPNSAFTHLAVETVEVLNGQIQLKDNMCFVAVCNRYGKGTKGFGLVRNFGLKKGCIASTVSHDSHNLTIVYDTPENASVAANELRELGGGMTAVDQGKVLRTLKLEIGGLMTGLEAKELSMEAAAMKEVEGAMGLSHLENPLLRIVTLALPVIPQIKMSDLGMVDVFAKKIIPLEAE